MQPYLGTVTGVSTVVITLVMSYFSLVFGELVPKRIAMQKAEALSFAFIGVLRVVAVVTRPFVKLLSVSTNLSSACSAWIPMRMRRTSPRKRSG